MRVHGVLVVASMAFAMAASPCANAQTLYKLIDKNGKITYSEEKPKNFDGQVIPLNINPNANTTTSSPAPQAAKPKAPPPGKPAPPSRAQELNAAQERLDKAKAALASAKDNPSDSDQQILGNKGGGVRFVPTPEYQEKIQKLEQDVKSAEENLAKLQK